MSNSEEYARKHYGLLEIVQTAIGGLILLIASVVYWTIRDYGVALQAQVTDIAVIKSQMREVSSSVAQNQQRVDAQIATLTNLSAALIRLDTKQTEDERQLEELRQTKKLK